MELIPEKENKLVLAIGKEDWPAVRRICEHEQNLINTVDENGTTPLMFAAYRDAPEDVMLRLIDDATAENLEHASNGVTILHYLALYADAPAAAMRRVFQRTSKHINKRDRWGQTALHWCLERDLSYDGHRQTALCLMRHGASSTIKDDKGKTPIDLYNKNRCTQYGEAKRKERKELRDLLKGQVPREVLARGPEAKDAFLAAIQEGSKCVNETRLMLVGPERVGKTSLTKALTEQEFDATEEVTDGIELCRLDVQHTTDWKVNPTKGNVSEARQQYHKAVAEGIAAKILPKKKKRRKKHEKQPPSQTIPLSMKDKIKKLQSGEVTKDITKPRNASPDAPEQSHDEATTSQGVDRMQIPVNELLDGLMTVKDSASSVVEVDAPMRASSQEDSASPTTQDVPEEIIPLVLEILQKQETRGENEGIEETVEDLTLSIWDFAGQDLYYITHLVFLVSRAIYIICFNLCHDLNAPAKVEIYKQEVGKISVFHYMTNLDFIIFWLRSIYSNTTKNPSSNQEQLSPPIFIVGTHFLSLPGNAQERLALAEEKFAVIQKKLSGTPFEAHVVSKYYAIDNSLRSPLDQSIVDLRDHITKVAKQQHYMGESIPIKWLDFLHEIEQLCNKQKNSINFKEVKDLAAKCGIIDEIQLFTLLHFYHDLGNIVYYGKHDTPDSALNDIIILNANWLISIFRRVFTVKGQSERWAKFKSSWKRLDGEGLLEEKLIKHMLHDFLDILESLLELMQKFDLLCVKTQSAEMPTLVGSPEEGNRFFYVPSLLKKQGDEMVSMDHLVKYKSMVVLYIDFNGFLPEGLFYRLVVRLVQWSQSKGGEPRLYYQQAILYVDEEHNMILRILPQKRSFIQVAIMRASYVGRDEAEPCPDICKMVLAFLDENLLDLGHTWMKRIDFGFCVLCSVCDNKEMTHFHELKKCLDKKLVQCGIQRMKTKQLQRLFGDWKQAMMETNCGSSGTYQAHYNRLKQNITSLNMRIRKDVAGDGNCFFYCIQDQLERLGLPVESVATMRTKLVKCLHNLDEEDPLKIHVDKHYLERLKNDGNWVDAVAVRGMSRVLNRNIRIVTSRKESIEKGYLVNEIKENSNSEDQLLLGLIGESHYISLGASGEDPGEQQQSKDQHSLDFGIPHPPVKIPDFQTMLINVSTWYDDHDLIDKLKVLYKDMVTTEDDLLKSTTTMDLFELLKRDGHLKSTNIKVMIDTIRVTGTRGVVEGNEILCDANSETNITAFSTHRQKLIQLGNVLSKDDIRKLGDVYSVARNRYKDQWTLILNLEKREEIREDRMSPFIENLKNIGLHLAARKLEEEWRTDKPQTIDNMQGEDGLSASAKVSALISTATLSTPTEGEDEPSASARVSALISTGTSHMDFQTMLMEVSRWYDRWELTNMLKVLYKDKIKLGYLKRSKTTMDLFNLLIRAGHLKSTDLKVLIDTINVTDTRGVIEVNDLLRSAHSETNITAFSIHRQKLIQLGNVLSADDVTELDNVYDMSLSQYGDQWTLILNLENLGVIRENQMQPFIAVLKRIKLYHAAIMLEEEWMEQ